MSLNAGINATIALIEDRPEQFKEMLRASTSDVRDLSAVRMRLNKALNYYSATKIRWALMRALALEPAPESSTQLEREAYYAGVRSVENIFEELVKELEAA